MSVDLRKLDHALAVERTRSFTVAAEELRLTQSALSRSIAALEAEWGVRIFERDRAGVAATVVGREFLREAAKLVAEANALDRKMKLRGAPERVSLALGMGPFLGELVSDGIFKRMAKSQPNVFLGARIELPERLIEGVVAGEIDVAVFSSGEKPRMDGLLAEFVCEPPRAFVMRAGHAMAAKSEIALADLADTSVLVSPLTELSSFGTGRVLSCGDLRLSKEMIQSGDSLWYISPLFVRREIAAGQLCARRIAADVPVKSPAIWVVSRPAPSKGVAALVGVVKTEVRAAFTGSLAESSH